MNNRLLLAKYNQFVLTALQSDGEITELNFEHANEGSIVGNIYVGIVENIVKTLDAAFVSYAKGKKAYLPLEESSSPFGDNKRAVRQGDYVIIQITNEAIKTKPPKATASYINFTGRYAVLTCNKTGIGISSKITDNTLRRLYTESFSEYLDDDYGIIIRTNAATADILEIKSEIIGLIDEYRQLKSLAMQKSKYTLLREEQKSYLAMLRNINFSETDGIITDDAALYAEALEYIRKYQPEETGRLVKLPEGQSVFRTYGLDTVLKHAFNERVWLDCGGYLVIQPTEALTVIDVNSGKCILKNKSHRDTALKVNLEACGMIAKQLRLRNLSGIILVDFIDMEKEEDRLEILTCLKKAVSADRIKTVVVDMTKLNLVEITRKKIRKPIYEQLETKG